MVRFTNVKGEGHQIFPVTLPEAVYLDVIVFMHGACEGAEENIKYRWDPQDLSFNEDIANTITCTN